jgi:tetratricopeptide (TPR) repeat protein
LTFLFVNVCFLTFLFVNVCLLTVLFVNLSARPNDSRMVVALGECYEKLDRLQEAKKCFRKAHNIGDVEGGALYKLAK